MPHPLGQNCERADNEGNMSEITQTASRGLMPPSSDAKMLRRMEWIAGIVGSVLVIASMTLSFIHATCKQVSDLISEQNAAATKIGLSLEYYAYFNKLNNNADKTAATSETMSPPGLLHDLIDFSRRNVTIIYTADRFNLFNSLKHIFVSEDLLKDIAALRPTDGSTQDFDHFAIDAQKTTVSDVLKEGYYQIRLYQAIRDHAEASSESWEEITGQIVAYLMPIFYAVLGAFLYTFRSWCREGRIPYWPDRISRLLMAGIAGIVIGAMNGLFPKEISVSPLALAFIVGYSIEVFTSRLDAWIQSFRKDQGQPDTRPLEAD
jgi:hypothetical protein